MPRVTVENRAPRSYLIAPECTDAAEPARLDHPAPTPIHICPVLSTTVFVQLVRSPSAMNVLRAWRSGGRRRGPAQWPLREWTFPVHCSRVRHSTQDRIVFQISQKDRYSKVPRAPAVWPQPALLWE